MRRPRVGRVTQTNTNNMRTKTINGTEYSVAYEVWSTRNAWGHNGYLFINGEIANKAKARYYNRSWESYPGQSVMRGAIYNEISDREAELVERYKRRNGLRRLTKQRKAEAIADDAALNELREFLSTI